MILSDRDLRQRLRDRSIAVEPLADLELQLQPANIDLRLGRQFRRAVRGSEEVEELAEGDDFVLGPGSRARSPSSARTSDRRQRPCGSARAPAISSFTC